MALAAILSRIPWDQWLNYMGSYITKDVKVERAVLIGIITPQQTEEQAQEYIEELDFLAQPAGAVPVKHFLQKLSYADPKTFVGKGKRQK